MRNVNNRILVLLVICSFDYIPLSTTTDSCRTVEEDYQAAVNSIDWSDAWIAEQQLQMLQAAKAITDLTCQGRLECTSDVYKHDCHVYADCKDTPTAFTCTCKEGYEGDGVTRCIVGKDGMAKCATDSHCPVYSYCKDEKCKCKGDLVGNGGTCELALPAECDWSDDACHANASCINKKCICKGKTVGGGKQECREYQACPEGQNYCGNINVCLIDPLFPNQCGALNECEKKGDFCPRRSICELRGDGSYGCNCKSGFRMYGADDYRSCTDINECKDGGHSCTNLQTCQNLEGKYKCICYKEGENGQCDECSFPFGLEWINHRSKVRDDQLSASSEDMNYPAYVGRYNFASAWCANPSTLQDPLLAKSQYLQIDMLIPSRVLGILTQGRGLVSVVKNYYLYYATDPGAFHSFRHGKNYEKFLFQGNDGLYNESHTNWLDRPLVARYIRLNPQEWIKRPCLRVELYGCFAECISPLGMEDFGIKNYQITASSEDIFKKEWARFSDIGWCVSRELLSSVAPGQVLYHYLQIDLLVPHLIRGVVAQGAQIREALVTSFYVQYSFLGDEWFRYHTGFEYYGSVLKQHWLEPPLVARFIRFNPQASSLPDPLHICMKVEVYGCSYKNCTNALGMEAGLIKDVQITASSIKTEFAKAAFARLNNKADVASLSLGSWCADDNDQNPYLQIDLLTPHTITELATQGGNSNYIQKYSLSFSYDKIRWFNYKVNDIVVTFDGNINAARTVRRHLTPPLTARVLRIHPILVDEYISFCARVELYGCKPSEGLSHLPQYLALGMESFRISDLQLTPSSQVAHSALYSRLNQNIHSGAWIPEIDHSQYLQIDLGWLIILTGIATQGHPEKQYRILTYRIKHTISLDETFTFYPMEFDGNVQENSTVYEPLDPTRCRYVRIYPLSWSEKAALRTELYGYESECYNRLVVSSPFGRTLLSASSNESLGLPGYGRLHAGLGTGAWCAGILDANQYLQADLRGEAIVTGVATQGQKFFDNWVLYFTLAYSLDGRAWNGYAVIDAAKKSKQGVSKMFTGNVDRNTTALHFFASPLVTRYLRFQPQSWNNKICMRVEIYGCNLDAQSVCAKCGLNARCISNNDGSENCVCRNGFFGDGEVCTDRDECSSAVNPCTENQVCENTEGSYHCRCKEGFLADSLNSSCIDVDECKDPSICPPHSTCVNTPGSFKCKCDTGMSLDAKDKTCKDIDECAIGSFKCHALARCINTYGSYACSCPNGYKGNGRAVCADVNECRQKPSPCDNGSVCENTKGSFRCHCKTGFIREGDKCVDYDECSSKSFLCQLHNKCINTIGSYKCECKQGFSSNGPYCVDFNECLSDRSDCDVNAWCTNTAGSYKCFCKEGYHGNGTNCEKDV